MKEKNNRMQVKKSGRKPKIIVKILITVLCLAMIYGSTILARIFLSNFSKNTPASKAGDELLFTIS